MNTDLLYNYILPSIISIALLSLYLWRVRKQIVVQKLFFPFIYLIQVRTKFGLKLMEKWGTKYREFWKFFGLCSIGIGFAGLIFVFFSLMISLFKISPGNGVSLVVPGVYIPGVGRLGFMHWIISIFILATVHEFCHGVVAIANKLKIKNTGPAIFGFIFPIIPAAYVEPDEKALNKASDVAQYSVYAAGPVSNIVLGIILILILNIVFVPIELNNTYSAGYSFEIIDTKLPAGALLGTGRFSFTHIDNTEVDGEGFLKVLDEKKPGDVVTLSNVDEEYSITLTEYPNNPEKAYLGVRAIQNLRKYYNETFGKIFAWFKTLFKWLGALNLFIGIANLLPIAIVDGGLMTRLLFRKLIKSEKKADKLWIFISILTLAMILFGLFAGLFLKYW